MFAYVWSGTSVPSPFTLKKGLLLFLKIGEKTSEIEAELSNIDKHNDGFKCVNYEILFRSCP